MNSTLKEMNLGGIGDALLGLLDAQMRLGNQLLSTLRKSSVPSMPGCCDIPEPCWMPHSVGEVVSHVCPGGAASLKLTVTNCDRISHVVQISAKGADAANVSIQPTTLSLGPKERDGSTLTFKVAPEAHKCDELEVVVWVHGCNDHYLRWIVRVGKQSGACCHEVAIEDCPDLIHHWYDHFYCHRSCFGQDRGKTDA